MGYLGGVFGVALIAGPLAGGWITDAYSWRWLFFINLPLGVAALAFIVAFLHLPHASRRHSLDYVGFVTLGLGLEFGQRLASVGVLDVPEDVFHLKLDELEQIDGAWPPPQLDGKLQALVVRRKAKRAELEGTLLVDPRFLRQVEVEGDVLLRGISGSPGVAEGPVRIVHDSSEFGNLRSGEVLVAPYTNPAWTPLFQWIVAVVVDSGGRDLTRPSWRANMASRP